MTATPETPSTTLAPRETPSWLAQARAWVERMRTPGSLCRYRLHQDSEPTVFASCFALLFLHLCGETREWDASARSAWSDYLKGFQEEGVGLFSDPGAASRVTDPAHDAEHLDRQLTGFCLSGLRALGTRPRFPIRYVAPWFSAEHTRKWLDDLDWRRSSNSGNKAMFVAIMLIEELERGNQKAGEGLNAWFDWHDSHSDPQTGYWGANRACRYFQGMTGFVHQFLIYDYTGRPFEKGRQVVDRTLSLQQADGLFSPMLGGGACDDLDAIHVLCHFHHRQDYRRSDIGTSLRRAQEAILENQNPDGGFSWARRFRFGLGDWATVAAHNFHWNDPVQSYWALRLALAGQRRLNSKLKTGWSSQGRRWSQSSIWDTWFRSLALAEIETVLDAGAASRRWQALRAPNFGWFILPEEGQDSGRMRADRTGHAAQDGLSGATSTSANDAR